MRMQSVAGIIYVTIAHINIFGYHPKINRRPLKDLNKRGKWPDFSMYNLLKNYL